MKYICKHCEPTDPCRFSYEEPGDKPEYCPVDGSKHAEWEPVEIAPENLPDWCKKGKWVWISPKDPLSTGYMQIEAINNITLGLPTGSIDFCEAVKQARLRSWMPEEAIGKIVYVAKCCYLITSADEFMAKVGSEFIKLDRLRDFYYQLDGSPCGVLEHLENGEWVK